MIVRLKKVLIPHQECTRLPSFSKTAAPASLANLCKLDRAMRAPGRVDRDLAFTFWALLSRRIYRLLLTLASIRQVIDRRHYEEIDRDRDNEERDNGVQEVAVAEDATVDRKGEI